ncbi:MAG: hypothetical protein CO013_12535 [Syntrophobacterales bacterium CG_4_8_14_3_um_filter_58_8]|nr:MAG: hypothetical protein CO013_12535 [Syntrophobacterales bacterium CG_4_8_14_3_um_filter_58_8]
MIPLLILLAGGKGRAYRANGRRSICKSAAYVKKDGRDNETMDDRSRLSLKILDYSVQGGKRLQTALQFINVRLRISLRIAI